MEARVGLKARFPALDGLRGVAALVVLVHHSLLTIPALSEAYYDNTRARATDGPLELALTYTPLHLAWAGGEAVFLFFILSGFVLALPVLRSERFAWMRYYAVRAIRLYGPVWVAVALGAVVVTLTARYHASGLGPWLNQRPEGYTVTSVARDLSLLDGSSGVVSPLWSLQWELWFSLLLPLYLAVLVTARRSGPLVIGAWMLALLACITIATFLPGRTPLKYLPMFAIGVLIAVARDRIGELWQRMSRRRGLVAAVTGGALLLAVCTWLLPGLGVPAGVSSHFVAAEVAGCGILVISALHARRLRAVLETRVAQWLGGISFSLYLVHEPIVIAARYLVIGHSPWLGLAIGLPCSLAVAWLFARLVERRLQRLAKTAGSRVAATPA